MTFAGRLLAEASQRLELPVDVLTGVPRVEIIGQNEVSMEPQEGLLAYSSSEILINSRVGPVTILGQGMTIKLMNQERIVISGTISCVQLPENLHE